MLPMLQVVENAYYRAGFNGHPPLWVNATDAQPIIIKRPEPEFQWAPTLGGECYRQYRPAPQK